MYKSALEGPCQVVNELEFEFKIPNLALSFKEKGNSLNRMASLETPFILIVSHFSKDEAI